MLKCLTKRERSQWLLKRGHVEDPAHAHESDEPRFRLEFYAPEKYGSIQTFAWRLMEAVGVTGEILFYIEDTDLCMAEQEFVFSSLWKNMGERRHFLETPACTGTLEDAEVLAGLFALSAAFSWRSYLYGDKDQTCLFNWEGEICNIWTGSEMIRDRSGIMIKNWGFSAVKPPA
jgi:hypothetical protein